MHGQHLKGGAKINVDLIVYMLRAPDFIFAWI